MYVRYPRAVQVKVLVGLLSCPPEVQSPSRATAVGGSTPTVLSKYSPELLSYRSLASNLLSAPPPKATWATRGQQQLVSTVSSHLGKANHATTIMPLVDPVTMSSSSSSASAAAGKPPTELHPIHAHAAPASQAARHAVPALLAALFLAAFPRLVADPVPTMWTALPVVTALQLVYAFVCLPMAGSTAPATGKTKKPRPGEKKKAGDSSGPNLIVVCS